MISPAAMPSLLRVQMFGTMFYMVRRTLTTTNLLVSCSVTLFTSYPWLRI